MPLSRILLLCLVATLTLAACGNSRLNPLNWFGSSRSVEVDPAPDAVNPLIPRKASLSLKDKEDADDRVPVANVTQLRVEQTPAGAIIYATGEAVRQGAYDAVLQPADDSGEPDADGVLVLNFMVDYPSQNTPVGGASLRQVHAARTLSKQTLQTTKIIRVVALNNARETRRN